MAGRSSKAWTRSRLPGSGIPAPKIVYTLCANSRAMLDHAVAHGTEVLRASGATDVLTEAPIGVGGWHLMGAARMGTDPERSVNEWGRSHDVGNLFVMDRSLFVTSAGVNPRARFRRWRCTWRMRSRSG